jgi:hypothetical protein
LPDAFYTPSQDGPLRQGEILSGLRCIVPLPGSAFGELKADIIEYRYAVILSQDCDLLQDFDARSEGAEGQAVILERRKLINVLFCDAIPVDELQGRINDGRVWKAALQNKNERYQFLRTVTPEEDARREGIPSGLGIDFKRYFSLTVEDTYAQVKQLKNRRAVLQTPYAEHLSVRFFQYQLRIPLPKEHHVE